jgi:amidase
MNKILLLLSIVVLSCSLPEQVENINISELTIADIHKAYQAGQYNSQELIAAYIDRIEHFDDSINSITTINPKALAIAKALDAEYKKTGILRPLHGIPLIVKDNINTAGMPTTGGAKALQDFIPDEDAFIIKKLVDAGVIILAKSNMAEWAFSPKHTESSTAGTTHNPYNLNFVPAGSSGGTGAAVASNFGTVGLGTDTGNSIRGPSSHNALVGFRTTIGLISRSGIIPLNLRNDVVGPMCRTVEDATKVMEIMIGIDPLDPVTNYSANKSLGGYQQFLLKDGLMGARIGVLRELSENDPSPEIKALFEQSIKDLQALGAEIVDPLVIPDFASLRQNQWCAEFRDDIESYLATYVKRDSMKTLEDIIRVGTSSDYAADGLAYFAEASGRSENSEIECLDPYTDALRIAFREAIEYQMDEYKLDAIIYPSWNNRPASINAFNEEYKGDNSQVISPHTGQPAFTVPMGFTADNLPAGLQFLARIYDEPTLIKLVYAYEQGTKHRRPPIVN